MKTITALIILVALSIWAAGPVVAEEGKQIKGGYNAYSIELERH